MPRRTTKQTDTTKAESREDEATAVVDAPSNKQEMKTEVTPSMEVPVKVVKVTRPRRKVSFEQWARARGVKLHHKGGLKAHVPNHKASRSYENWDKAFADY